MTGPLGMSELFWFHALVEVGVGLVSLLTWVVILKLAPEAVVRVIRELEEAEDG